MGAVHRGRAVQVDPIKPTLRPRGSKRLKLEDEKRLSNFAFNFNLRRHIVAAVDRFADADCEAGAYTRSR